MAMCGASIAKETARDTSRPFVGPFVLEFSYRPLCSLSVPRKCGRTHDSRPDTRHSRPSCPSASPARRPSKNRQRQLVRSDVEVVRRQRTETQSPMWLSIGDRRATQCEINPDDLPVGTNERSPHSHTRAIRILIRSQLKSRKLYGWICRLFASQRISSRHS